MLLHWQFIDLDEEIARISGMAVPEIFAREGERGFRDRETVALKAIAERRRVVVATGAGVVERASNWALLHKQSRVVALLASAETIWRRLLEHAASPTELGRQRPMLAGSDPLQRLGSLYRRRAPLYAEADETLVVENLTPADAASSNRGEPGGARVAPRRWRGDGFGCMFRTQQGRAMRSSWAGTRSHSWQNASALRLPKRLHIISDDAVGSLYEPPLLTALQDAGFAPLVCRVPVGEGSKSAAQLGAIYDWLAARRAERSEAILALGGGVVGDLAGYAAATWLRGVPLVQIPTSLLAQVDASIGGKVAINHPQGKNLIGAFYPPLLVLSDPAMLMTLPERQYIEGLAEVVKHGVALDAGYFDEMELNASGLLRREPVALTQAIVESAVDQIGGCADRRARRRARSAHSAQLRAYHRPCARSGGGLWPWLHGEAVAGGMCVAARMGARLGVTPAEVVERQEQLLTYLGLPTSLEGVSATALMGAIFWDKKVRGGAVRWVLPTALGHSAVVSDVPLEAVREALLAVGAEAQ